MFSLSLKIEQNYEIDKNTNFNIVDLESLKEKLLNELELIIITKYPNLKKETNTFIELDVSDIPY